MSDDFVHLHVASSASMRYGACHPSELVERAASLGQSALALTDRDGLYGAVRFVRACAGSGIAPVLGVDLALGGRDGDPGAVRVALTGDAALGRLPQEDGRDRPHAPGWGAGESAWVAESTGRSIGTSAWGPAGAPQRRGRVQPVKGGTLVDDQRPRVVVLARGQGAGLEPGVGWARLCRLVTQTHLAGERGSPRTSPALLARAATPVDGRAPVVVLLGPDSDVGRAVLARRHGHARALLRAWQEALPDDSLRVELVCHGGPEGTPASLGHAARMWALARECGVPAVLTAAVRHAVPEQARVVDVLDAARRMVALDERHLDRTSTAGHLADTPTMHAVARRLEEATGSPARAADLLGDTLALAGQCHQDLRSDLGIGAVHLPEPEILGVSGVGQAHRVLTERCTAAVGTRYPGAGTAYLEKVRSRLDEELGVIAGLGYPTYFLTVAQVCDLIRDNGVRVAARGSGAGSLVTYLLGISGVDPMEHGLLMERFCSPLRAQLPDIDVDVESARRTEIYERILERFGSERVTCVSMAETYRVRHAVRDVAATLGLPPGEIDVIAKAFPHIRARDARAAVRDLPELRRQGLDAPRMQLLMELVESLDGLPRHIAMHPCGVILSNTGLLDRTPVEASWLGFPMSQFDKDDVEELGLLKLDVLGIRMQSAMAHAVEEIERVDGVRIDLDDRDQVPLDDSETFALIQSTRTLGCFQIESPGQRELVGKFAPENFTDIIIDISLFRPGPVKSDMIRPFLHARQGWGEPDHLHRSLVPYLEETCGVVVFHEQVLQIVAETTGVSLAQADEVRRAMGTPQGRDEVEVWWRQAAADRGYRPTDVERIWEVLAAFASFGFCKAHAAAFALPTYQSAWLKTHHTAAFLAGVLTHDPGMYPKRLILDEARTMGVHVLGLDVNASREVYRVERVHPAPGEPHGIVAPLPARPGLPAVDRVDEVMAAVERRAGEYGIRLSLAEVRGISDDEVTRIVAGQPYASLADLWQRARPSRPTAERLVLAGGFDSVHRVGRSGREVPDRGGLTRRDLLLHVRELDRWSRHAATGAGRSRAGRRLVPPALAPAGQELGGEVAARTREQAVGRRTWHTQHATPTQLTLQLGDEPAPVTGSGLPEMTEHEQLQAELEVLGLDVSQHVVEGFGPMLADLGVTRSRDLLSRRNGSEVLIAGAKVATQTPPVRSGRRVVFLTLDDGSGPADATFFEDVQGPFAATVFHSWLLLVRGVVRRTGPRGLSVRATGAWELGGLLQAWEQGGAPQVRVEMLRVEEQSRALLEETAALQQPGAEQSGRRVLVHASGYRQSPYADVRPAGGDTRAGVPGSKLWHASPGSSGW
ncbi:DNA polymerase III subunit alpha [Ornithinimicrobium tianjinense]|uniref:DNA polymerase III subunit alpha n=1 Tax=Ornithinimicrobium tianjinense TaxID=1195761 RepID=A0A917F2W0_9MICO|nr:DNA polymerase III subunit alpha [Ornithinimicrobium tianjinense]GGF45326.1 DNA-directed DNA polymerase [Ornithinimicrobium tianjinense]